MDYDELAADVAETCEEEYNHDISIVDVDDVAANFVVDGKAVELEWGDPDDKGQYNVNDLAHELHKLS